MGEDLLEEDSYLDLEAGPTAHALRWGPHYLEPLSMSSTPKTEPVLWRSWEKGRRSSTGSQRGDSSPGPR